ncbi:MAG: Peptidase, family [Actinomycetia bacterium]|nr:Peptidase, family [Actinomycetes bacterium]
MKRAGAWLAVLGVLAGLTAPASAAAPTPEQRSKDIKQEVERLRRELGEAADEETDLLAELEVSRNLRKELDAKVGSLDAAIAAAQADLDAVNTELAAAVAAEQAADAAVADAERELDTATEVLRAQAVQAFMEFGNTPTVSQLVLQLDDLNDASRVAAYVQAVADRQTDVVDHHRRLQEDTTLLKAQAADAKAAVAAHQAQVSARKAALEAARAEQAAARADVAAEAATEQRLLGQVQAKKGDYLKKINQLEKESKDIAAELRRRQAGQKVTPSGHGVLGYPTASPVITSTFGYRIHPIYGDRRLHAGIDLRAATGTSVLSAGAGTVVFAGWKSGYGNTVIIDHGGQIATLYGHNSSLAVSVGDTVKRGERIAAAGSTGNSTGPHVHFEVRVGGTPVDPMKYL